MHRREYISTTLTTLTAASAVSIAGCMSQHDNRLAVGIFVAESATDTVTDDSLATVQQYLDSFFTERFSDINTEIVIAETVAVPDFTDSNVSQPLRWWRQFLIERKSYRDCNLLLVPESKTPLIATDNDGRALIGEPYAFTTALDFQTKATSRRLALHEVLHSLGLEHSDKTQLTADTYSIMHGTMSENVAELSPRSREILVNTI